MFCHFCGGQLQQGQMVCPRCGRSVTTQSPPQQQAAPYAPPVMQQPVAQQPMVQQPPMQQRPVAAPPAPVAQPPYANAPMQPAYAYPPAPAPAPKKKPLWILWLIIPLVLILVVGIVFAVVAASGPSDEELIRERIEIFEEAYDEADIKTMIGCFDRSTRSICSAVYNVAGGFLDGLAGFDLPLDDLLTFGGALAVGEMDLDAEIMSISINEDTAQVQVRIGVDGYMEDLTVYMCKEGNDWYIDFAKTAGFSMHDIIGEMM